jgi:hypothetical protein
MHSTSRAAPLVAAALALGSVLAFDTARGQAVAVSEPDAPLPASVDVGGARASLSEEQTPPSGEDSKTSDEDLKTFAKIYTELQEADARFEHDMASAKTVQEAKAVSAARDRASDAALRAHGWSRGKFDRVASAINRDPALIERAIELFDENSDENS